ncbi:MAG TPA: hypothetical protein VID95_09385, partial [Candidatus Limnocylindrales bacterium]
MNVRRVGRIGLLVGIALFLVGAGSVSARSATDTRGPKVVLIVGPAGAATPYYRQLADQAAAAAAKLTPNVVRVYSPDATWEHVKAALQGASVVVYLGHGNGWPSIYRNSLYPPSQDGFGLNPHEGAADAHQYFGEDKIGSEIKLAPNAVVIFSHLCYASGNTEPGLAEGTLAQAQQRVDNYAAGFFRAGAAAVIADAYLSPTYYVTSVLSKRSTVDSIWRRAPNVNDHFLTFASARTKGAIAEMDPDQVSSGFHRSLVVRPGVNTIQVRGSAPIRPVVVDPQVEPSLAPLGVTIGSPDLTTPPTAGSASRLILPIAKDAMGLLPTKLMVGTRWDRLDAPAAGGQTPADGSTTPPGGTTAPAAASDTDPGTTATTTTTLPDLVTPEVAGELVAPVRAQVLASGGLSVPVRIPAAPGLYRLVATLHEADGLAYDASTQALVPALVVRVTGPRTAVYTVPASATGQAGQPFALVVDVTNLGSTPWGHAASRPTRGDAELIPASRATLVARWISLGATVGPADPASSSDSSILPAGLAPGATVTTQLTLTAPVVPGEYLLVLDVLDPDSGSLAALGVPPG